MKGKITRFGVHFGRKYLCGLNDFVEGGTNLLLFSNSSKESQLIVVIWIVC